MKYLLQNVNKVQIAVTNQYQSIIIHQNISPLDPTSVTALIDLFKPTHFQINANFHKYYENVFKSKILFEVNKVFKLTIQVNYQEEVKICKIAI
jgi:hypothetical protein